MKVPKYQQSGFSLKLQRRILLALVVAGVAVVAGMLSFPAARNAYQLHRLQSEDPAERLAALNVLTRSAVRDAGLRQRVAAAMIAGLAEDDEQTAGVFIRLASWAIQHVPAFKERMLGALETDDDAVFRGVSAALREAGAWEPEEVPLSHRCRWAALRCLSADPVLRAAAVRELADIGPSGERHLLGVVVRHLHDPVPAVRLAAVEACAVCLPAARSKLLSGVLTDTDPSVRDAAELRLELLRPPDEVAAPPSVTLDDMLAMLEQPDYTARLAAFQHIQRVPLTHAADRSRLAARVAELAGEGLATGNGGLAGTALETLSALGDERYLPLMQDVAAAASDQPMLRFMAARAAAGIDAEAGGQALINLFAQESDVVRDLAAVALSDVPHPASTARLVRELFAADADVRGPAALALALQNLGEANVHGTTFAELLRLRTTLQANNPDAEPDWKPRGYYLCSRLALGESAVRVDLGVFEINEHFPRLALYVALLHSGETTPLDVVLGGDALSDADRMVLLRDMRFGEIIERYFPNAPVIAWSAPENVRSTQLERLKVWWSMYRRQLSFDALRHRYAIMGR